tara:strand:+ start:778 stop:972 length:195 start_codon:yes stop_codon:yes gene_type:complete
MKSERKTRSTYLKISSHSSSKLRPPGGGGDDGGIVMPGKKGGDAGGIDGWASSTCVGGWQAGSV